MHDAALDAYVSSYVILRQWDKYRP